MPRGLGRRPSRGTFTSLKRPFVAVPVLFVVAACLYFISASALLRRRSELPGDKRRVYQLPGNSQHSCVAWRQTNFCSPYGTRAPSADRGCSARITMGPGFCECSDRLTVRRSPCGHYEGFTCEQECAKLAYSRADAVELPSNVTCPDQGTRRRLQARPEVDVKLTHNVDVKLTSHIQAEHTARQLWHQLLSAMEKGSRRRMRIPEVRTGDRDWVAEGKRLPWRDIRQARLAWQEFAAAAPGYPEHLFNGQGVVILAGGNTYMVPAWVNIHALRRTGCQLPVEMFFPAREFPTTEMETALGRLGVRCCKLPEVPRHTSSKAQYAQKMEAQLAGFAMKITALLLSSFREVIFLDSDNVAVADPAALLEAPEYMSTGALLWNDYWTSAAAPDLKDILDIPALVPGSFESGQMVFDKQRAWRALVLTAFFNSQSELWYELFSSWMGKGDKETFAYAFEATRTPYSTVATPVGSVGFMGQACGAGQRGCRTLFLGNTMTQHAPGQAGRLMFMHTNLSPKWNLHLPGSWEGYTPRWQITGSGAQLAQQYPEAAGLERYVYQVLVDLRCAPWLPSYIQALAREDRMGVALPLDLPPDGFHPINEGVNFAKAYRLGMRGPFQRFTELSWQDKRASALRSWLLHHVNAVRRLFSWRAGYFRTCLTC